MDFLQILIFVLAGIVAGLTARYAFLRMPDSWLLDYDETEAPQGFAQMRTFPFSYQGLLFTILIALLYARIPGVASGGWQIASAMIAIPVLLLILVADWKTRIIPDQLTLLLIVPGVIRIISSITLGETWFRAAGLPLLAAVIAGGALLLIGLAGQFLMHREAMGMGDVKMIAAAAFLVGLNNLLMLVLLSFFTAALIAVPLLVRRTLSERRAARGHRASQTDPADLALVQPSEDASEENAKEDAEEDTAIAFGPFIAISALLLILFNQQIDQLAAAYWSLFIL